MHWPPERAGPWGWSSLCLSFLSSVPGLLPPLLLFLHDREASFHLPSFHYSVAHAAAQTDPAATLPLAIASLAVTLGKSLLLSSIRSGGCKTRVLTLPDRAFLHCTEAGRPAPPSQGVVTLAREPEADTISAPLEAWLEAVLQACGGAEGAFLLCGGVAAGRMQTVSPTLRRLALFDKHVHCPFLLLCAQSHVPHFCIGHIASPRPS